MFGLIPRTIHPISMYHPCVAQWLERPLGVQRPGFDPRPRHIKDVKTGRFALFSLELGINELGNRLGSSESV